MTEQITRYNAASGTLAGVTEAAEGEFVRYADIKHLLQGEPPARLPHGTSVTLVLPGFQTMPREGWSIENIDEPRPLKYRIRHPNGSLLDVLPECIALNR